MKVTNIRGRWPERRIPLQAVDMRVQIREMGGGRVWLRLENKLCPAFWLEIDAVVAEDGAAGNRAGGDTGLWVD
jgi:hypothetical protein